MQGVRVFLKRISATITVECYNSSFLGRDLTPCSLTGCELSRVFDDAVARLEHALDLSALGALRKAKVMGRRRFEQHEFPRDNGR